MKKHKAQAKKYETKSETKSTNDNIFCFSCGTKIKRAAEICPKCGVRQLQQHNLMLNKPIGRRRWIVALLLSVLLGWLGIDRFYMGLIGTGILKLITLGGLGVWVIIDIILIATNSLKDADGKFLLMD